MIVCWMGAEGHARNSPGWDPWRKRMLKTAETLRRLDAQRFETQIARIEECLRVDAAWNLEAALASCRRAPPHAARELRICVSRFSCDM